MSVRLSVTRRYFIVRAGTHRRQSRIRHGRLRQKSTKGRFIYTLATESKVDFVADLSPFCRKSTVAGLRSTLSPKLNMFNSVHFVESRRFLSPECRTPFRLCRMCTAPKRQGRLCRLSTKSTLSNSPLCSGLND